MTASERVEDIKRILSIITSLIELAPASVPQQGFDQAKFLTNDVPGGNVLTKDSPWACRP